MFTGIVMFVGVAVFLGTQAHAQDLDGYLENPQPNSAKSGIGIVSGWHCNAGSIEMQIDGGRLLPVAYGTERQDTAGVCGDSDNGFGFLLNYSGMGTGWHNITVYADGVMFGSADFVVSTLGQEFVSGLEKTVTVPAFPDQNTDAILRWEESTQNFQIVGVQPGNTLVGVWGSEDEVIAFGSDGTYFTDFCDAFETGTYSYDPTSYRFTSIVVAQDNNGVCGLADHGAPYWGLSIRRDGDLLYVTEDGSPRTEVLFKVQ